MKAEAACAARTVLVPGPRQENLRAYATGTNRFRSLLGVIGSALSVMSNNETLCRAGNGEHFVGVGTVITVIATAIVFIV